MSDENEVTDEAKPKTRLDRLLVHMPLPWTHEGHWAVSAKPESFHNFRSENAAEFFVMLGNAYHESMTRNAELAAECERLKAENAFMLGEFQRLQPGGSPPPGDLHSLVPWIRISVAAELTDLRTQLDAAKHRLTCDSCCGEKTADCICLDSDADMHGTIAGQRMGLRRLLRKRSDQLAAAQKTIADCKGREGRLREACEAAKKQIGDFLSVVYGQNLEVAGWHQNGDTQPLDTFIDDNIDADLLAALTAALAATDGGGE